MSKSILHDPLLHFLIIGAGLFLLFDVVNDAPEENNNRIVIEQSDIQRISSAWEKRWSRPPTQDELDGMIQAAIKEEVLYREAMNLGLDQDDTIVRRRLAQKINFLFSDLVAQTEPTDEVLQAYLKDHPDKFETSAYTSFRHIYFSADRRGAQAAQDAQKLLKELQNQTGDTDITGKGDAFMFQNVFEKGSAHEIKRMFGSQFTEGLSEVEAGAWQGPVVSGYGLHLVYVKERIPARLPELAEIRDQVISEWQSQQQREANEALYQSMRQRYEIVIEKPDISSIAMEAQSQTAQ